MSRSRPRVLIIGGGFGGLFCARRLARSAVDVIMLDRSAGHLFQPLLYQCATGTLSIAHISRPLREEFARYPNIRTLLGKAVEIDPDRRVVTAMRPDESTFTLDYDVLVVAAGMQQSYFGKRHFAEWAPGMKTLDDALGIRQRIFTAFEIAETLPPGPERDAWLTFAVSGGGPTGVELAGQIREMATRTLANEFHSIEPEEARVLLFDGGDRVLKTFAPDLSERAAQALQKLGVEIRLGVHVTDVRREGVTVTPKSGAAAQDYAARTVFWTAGVEAVPFARHLAQVCGVETDRAGRLAVAPDLSVPGYPEIFVVGDLVGRDNLPGVAENAMQGGLHAAACIRRDLAGRPRRKYTYRDLGSAAYISRGNALLQVGPLKVSGFAGWIAWGLLHIAFLTGVGNRISTVTTWLATIARSGRYHRAFMLGSASTPEQRYTWSSREDLPTPQPGRGSNNGRPGIPGRMTISPEDVRRLLDSDDGATLVLIEGRAEVITDDQKDSDAYRGALEVITRQELLDRIGGDGGLSDDRLAAQAASLDTAVNELGG
ncbi:NAD(P)/FAD-dependent oxidoreductase [Mycolicibacterium vaccae]|uniref:NAD(P)/FAD-dependent oxidoreductase n=1 Tax=Mycolicibacterium vaccae TaxID=1810 RepID=UPI00058C5CB6|nr:NAD(P)/FAD-dependent oxidoreductase [Mycolicibacterium vaccae]MCV7059987.1 NAD(P)/FAD-dependent oxidoreductase [Mycolicibacterium vaccae]